MSRSFSTVYAVTKKELYSCFVSPVAYIFMIIFLLMMGFFTFMIGNFFQRNEASLAMFFFWHPWLFMLLVPSVGMRTWAEERRSGTLELLLTLPIAPWEAILGKYIAGCVFLGGCLLLTFPMVHTVYYLGSPDAGAIFCGYLGSILMAYTFLAISSLTSSFTRNQVISFVVAFMICLLLNLAGWSPVTDFFVHWAPTQLVEVITSFSMIHHYQSIQKGVIDSRDILYYLSVIFFCLFATKVVLNMKKGR